MKKRFRDVIGDTPFIPIVEIEHPESVHRLCESLIAGGLFCLEITLRTPLARTAIRDAATAYPMMAIGAGTILSGNDIVAAAEDGAAFAVSPGSSRSIYDAAEETTLPLLPGIANPTDAINALERDYRYVKFFPAEAGGGVQTIASFSGPFPSLRMCPTGGLTLTNSKDYLSLQNVFAVAGSWVTTREAIVSGEWEEIRARAAVAAKLSGYNVTQ